MLSHYKLISSNNIAVRFWILNYKSALPFKSPNLQNGIAIVSFIKVNSLPFFNIYSQFRSHSITSIKKYCLPYMLLQCALGDFGF